MKAAELTVCELLCDALHKVGGPKVRASCSRDDLLRTLPLSNIGVLLVLLCPDAAAWVDQFLQVDENGDGLQQESCRSSVPTCSSVSDLLGSVKLARS